LRCGDRRRLELLEGLGWGSVSMAEYYWFLARLARHCTATAIAEFLGLSRHTISEDMAAAGIPRRQAKRPPKLYAGRRLEDIAAEAGVSVPAVYHRIRNNGAPVCRPRWRGRLYNGKTIRELAEEAGVSYRTMWGRIQTGK
jgi:hypothetical protein